MRSCRKPAVLALLLAFAAGSSLLAQPTPAPKAKPAPEASQLRAQGLAAAPQPDPRRTMTFQLVLLVAGTEGASQYENVPANARKALEDLKDFLPYKSYKLLDLAWLRSSRSAEAQVSGPENSTLAAQLDYRALHDNEIDLKLRLVKMPGLPVFLEAPTPNRQPVTAPQPAQTILESTFGMRAGETVVVGTAKLDGPAKALVVILSAIP